MAHEHEGNSRPTRPGTPLIRTTYTNRGGDAGRRVMLVLACVIASGVIHLVAVFMLFLVPVEKSSATAPMETTVIETKVEDPQQKQPDLENDEIGMDPDLPTNYDVTRIEEVSVPGAVNIDQAVGIKDAPAAMAQTIPPPPGFGDNRGQGGGVESAIAGSGAMFGFAGGLGSAKLIPGGFGGRSGATRQQMVTEGGGNEASEACVAAGLKWFAAHQGPDGRWSLDAFNQHGRCNCTGFGQNNDIAGTAFGLLPFLGAGQTHKGTGQKGSIYTKNVERALTYLMSKQNKEGDFGGGMYSHGLASIAMCEAYGLTSDPRLKASAQKAINFIAKAQGGRGGWDYGPGGNRNDTSVGGWQLMALKSGQMAGLEVPSRTLQGASKWLDLCASPDGGGYGYSGPGESPTMSAVGLLCRQYLGWGPRNPGLAKGVDRLKQLPPKAANTMYYNYYATQVMHHMGGDAWAFWNPQMRDLLIERQDKGADPKRPHHKGSWDPKSDAHGSSGGRLMVTSLSLLTLEVYYRHLPLYRRDMATTK